MKRLGLLALALAPLLAAHEAVAQSTGPEPTWSQQDADAPTPTPLEDPYMPPAGDPDIAGDDGLGEGSSPLNPAED